MSAYRRRARPPLLPSSLGAIFFIPPSDGGIVSYLWSWVPDGRPRTRGDLVLDDPERHWGKHAHATRMAKDMKKVRHREWAAVAVVLGGVVEFLCAFVWREQHNRC